MIGVYLLIGVYLMIGVYLQIGVYLWVVTDWPSARRVFKLLRMIGVYLCLRST